MKLTYKAIRHFTIVMLLCMAFVSGCAAEDVVQQSYSTTTLITGPITSAIDCQGVVAASLSIDYSLPVKSVISQVYVREGSMVKQGDPLYSVDEDYFTEQSASFESSFYQALEYSNGVYKTQIVTAPVSGSVRMLKAKPGVDILKLSATSSLCVIVRSDVMYLEIGSSTLNKGDEVIVVADGIEQKGKVVNIKGITPTDRTAVIEITTSRYEQGTSAAVYYPDINTLIGIGELKFKDKKAVYMTQGYVSDVFVSEGDYVKRGDKLFAVCIPSNDSWSSLEKVVATCGGRVKLLKAESGLQVSDIMDGYDQLAVISTAGTMYVDIESEQLLTGDAVEVTIGDEVLDCRVLSKAGNIARIELPGDSYEVGAQADVMQNGAYIGSGNLQLTEYKAINAPYGTITAVYVDENDIVEMGDHLFNVSIPSQKIAASYAKIEDLYAQMEQIDDYMLDNAMCAECDGIVGALNFGTGDTVEASQAVISVNPLSNYEIKTDISVDDLNDIYLGQKARAAFVNGIELEGSISHIDYNADSDTVELAIGLNDCSEISSGQVLPGMNADIKIIVAESENASYLPASAVYSGSQGDYVIVLGENGNTETRLVTTGIRTDESVEILSGLEQTDNVIVNG